MTALTQWLRMPKRLRTALTEDIPFRRPTAEGVSRRIRENLCRCQPGRNLWIMEELGLA